MEKSFNDYVNNRGIRCNCGGYEQARDHSPDCALELAWVDYQKDLRDEKAETEED